MENNKWFHTDAGVIEFCHRLEIRYVAVGSNHRFTIEPIPANATSFAEYTQQSGISVAHGNYG